jgi:hypothetical protein
MGVDCRIFLPPAARVRDVADVMGALAGLVPQKRLLSGSDGYYVKVEGVEIKSSHTPSMVTINLTAAPHLRLVGGEAFLDCCYFFESLDDDSQPCRYMIPSSTAFWLAVGHGLIEFFGGALCYSDADGQINERVSAKPATFLHAEDGDDWQVLQDAKLSVAAITEDDLWKYAPLSAYGLAR